MSAQTNSRWSNQLLGYNTTQPNNIGNLGCLVTAWGNMLIRITGDGAYTPDYVNNWMKANNGFLAGSGTFIWGVALGMGQVAAAGTTVSLPAVNDFLATNPNNYAILQVTKPGFPMHFVFAPEVNTIIDSEDGVQKAMSTYSFVEAHLYRAVTPAPAPAPVVPVNTLTEDTSPMTAEQETQAYQIVLNRTPTAGDGVPTGRTAMAFIEDAQGELTADRTAVNQQVDSLSGQVSSLQSTVVELNAELAAAKAAPAPTPFQDTYKALAKPIDLTTTVAGQAIDYDGTKSAVDVAQGTVFTGDTAMAGTFTADGLTLYRTAKSVAAGEWYGVPQALFATTKLSPTNVISYVLSGLGSLIAKPFTKKGTK